MKTIIAKKLEIGNIITFKDWTQDLIVQDVVVLGEEVTIETMGICQDVHGKETYIFKSNKEIEIW